MYYACRNVIQHPDEEKYRRLSTESVSFAENVWNFPSAKQFLMLTGWTVQGDLVVYPTDDMEPIKRADEALKKWRR